jgi:hypothetical protein
MGWLGDDWIAGVCKGGADARMHGRARQLGYFTKRAACAGYSLNPACAIADGYY